MHHHNRAYIDTVEADRRAAKAHKRQPADAAELERMVLAAAGGDRGAWAALIEKFTGRIRGVARAHRLTSHDVDDVVQTTWLRLLEHIDKVDEPRAVGAYLEVCGRHESLRILRSRKREWPSDDSELADQPVEPVDEQRLVAVERDAALAEFRAAVAPALERLPERQRALMSMLFADVTPSYQAIGAALGLPIGAIGPTRARALTRLGRDPAFARAIAKFTTAFGDVGQGDVIA
jgi:RNA polymerase sigma factor (sigma-70 family)